ncbi:MAG TPA: cation:proton antiporter [Bacteroidales bacterium]|nr:cation:proton antiporter [Bacteroidales bacterium]HSA43309.1 cation:proton antiporter [Bacteroidales bacterium]
MIELAPGIPSEMPFTITLLLLLLVARVLGEAFERLNQPAIIGEVLAGFILGPSLLNVVHYSNTLAVLSELGIFLLIILAGVEIRLEEIRQSFRGKGSWVPVMVFMLPLSAGYLTGLAFGFQNMLSLFIGLCMAVAALPVSIRVLMDLGEVHSFLGRKIISAAMFNDVLAFLILGILISTRETDSTIGQIVVSVLITLGKIALFALMIILIHKLFQFVTRRVPFVHHHLDVLINFLRGKESLFAITLLFVLFFAGVSEVLGLHFVIGSFFGAVLLRKELLGDENFDQIREKTSGITMGFLAPVFFASMGVQFNINVIGHYTLLVAVILIAFVSKVGAGVLGARLAGLSARDGLTLGIGLNAGGMMELLVAKLALQKGFIDTSVYSVLVILGIMTTLVSPYLLRERFRKMNKAQGG